MKTPAQEAKEYAAQYGFVIEPVGKRLRAHHADAPMFERGSYPALLREMRVQVDCMANAAYAKSVAEEIKQIVDERTKPAHEMLTDALRPHIQQYGRANREFIDKVESGICGNDATNSLLHEIDKSIPLDASNNAKVGRGLLKPVVDLVTLKPARKNLTGVTINNAPFSHWDRQNNTHVLRTRYPAAGDQICEFPHLSHADALIQLRRMMSSESKRFRPTWCVIERIA